MNNVLLVVMDRILTQTQVTDNVVEGDQYSLDLITLLRSDATSQRYPSSELLIYVLGYTCKICNVASLKAPNRIIYCLLFLQLGVSNSRW